MINRGLHESINILTESIIKENQIQRDNILILSISFILLVALGYMTEGYL